MVDKVLSLPLESIRPAIGNVSHSQLAQIGAALRLWLALE